MSDPIYKYHVFACTTTRPPGVPHPSCGQAGSVDLANYLREKVKDAELGGVHINPSSCLGVCDRGPAVVVYPEGTWYSVKNTQDMDDIFETHLKGGRIAENLLMPMKPTG